MDKQKRRTYYPKPKEKVNAKASIEKPEHKEEVKENEVRVISRPKRIVRKRTTKFSKHKVSYRKIVYVGTADKSTVKGAVTGNKYSFVKDRYKMPIATNVDERDYPGIIALKGKGCARRDPHALFITEQDWNLEISEAKRANS